MSENSKTEQQDGPLSDAEEEQVAAPVHDITATSVTGARVRRSTQKFTVAEPKADDTDEFQPPIGAGQKLKDIPGVCDTVAALGKKQAETLKALYMVMYSRRFQLKNLKVIKEHILEFSGVPETDAKARDVLVGKVARWKRSFVQEVMDVLGVDRSKKSFDNEEKQFDKDALIHRLVDWLFHPQEKKGGRKASTPKGSAAKKSKPKAEKPKAPTKRKNTTKDTAAKKKQKTPAATSKKRKAAAAEDEEDEEEDEDVASEGDESGSEYDDEDDAKAKKKSAKRSADARKAPTVTKRAAAKDDETKVSEEPAPSGALDADVKAKVKQIIEQGNAEELTVKKIVRQVSEELGRDLSSEKNAIKEFIKAGQ